MSLDSNTKKPDKVVAGSGTWYLDKTYRGSNEEEPRGATVLEKKPDTAIAVNTQVKRGTSIGHNEASYEEERRGATVLPETKMFAVFEKRGKVRKAPSM